MLCWCNYFLLKPLLNLIYLVKQHKLNRRKCVYFKALIILFIYIQSTFNILSCANRLLLSGGPSVPFRNSIRAFRRLHGKAKQGNGSLTPFSAVPTSTDATNMTFSRLWKPFVFTIAVSLYSGIYNQGSDTYFALACSFPRHALRLLPSGSTRRCGPMRSQYWSRGSGSEKRHNGKMWEYGLWYIKHN